MQNLFQNDANDISEMVSIVHRFFVKKINILFSSDVLILLKFCRLVVRKVRNYKYYLKLLPLAIAMETRKSLNEKSV